MRVLQVILISLLWLSACSAYRFLAVFPTPGKSHFIVAESLMKGLISKGHQIDIMSPFPQKKPYPNYTDIAELKMHVVLLNNMTYDHVMQVMRTNIINAIAKSFGNELCKRHLGHPIIQKLVRDPPKDPPYDAMIMEIFGAQCFAAIAYALNIPLIGLSTTSMYPWLNELIAQPENLAFVPNNFLAFRSPMNFWQRTYNVLHTFYAKLYFSYLTKPQVDEVRKYFGPNLPSVWDMKPALVLINSHIVLNGIQPMTPAAVQVGGIHIRDDDTPLSPKLKKWLDDSKEGFIYFTFGSMMMIETFPREILDIFYSSLAKIAPVRVLMKIPKPEKLPPGLPENIYIFPWIPQLKVLKHSNIKAFITHGGLLGTIEAIACGVPMIGIPLFADQFNNVDAYVARNIAVRLDIHKITKKNMDTALSAVLHDPRYKENIRNLSRRFHDEPMNPLDNANYWIEHVIKYGDDILRSPAIDLTSWQLYLVDVAAFLLSCVMIIIIIVILIMRFIMEMINEKSHKSSLSSKKTN
ncbi:hypothetical protein HN011_000242 [Eciton burchellii]|nr:hypothetical protein HN011_000242 [Eciton burchellii]